MKKYQDAIDYLTDRCYKLNRRMDNLQNAIFAGDIDEEVVRARNEILTASVIHLSFVIEELRHAQEDRP